MRVQLRKREYKNWCDLKSKGKGVDSFRDCKDVNKRIMEKRGLTNTEWIQILKMNGQVAPVRALHGRGQDSAGLRHGQTRQLPGAPAIRGAKKIEGRRRN